MKTFLAFVIICLFWPYAANAQSLTDREQADLIGPVKFVETYYNIFTMKDGKIVEGNRLLWHSVTYNINGNITERVSYDRLGSIYVKYLHTYDPAGRCIGYEEYYTNPDKTFTRPRMAPTALSTGNPSQHLTTEEIELYSSNMRATRSVIGSSPGMMKKRGF